MHWFDVFSRGHSRILKDASMSRVNVILFVLSAWGLIGAVSNSFTLFVTLKRILHTRSYGFKHRYHTLASWNVSRVWRHLDWSWKLIADVAAVITKHRSLLNLIIPLPYPLKGHINRHDFYLSSLCRDEVNGNFFRHSLKSIFDVRKQRAEFSVNCFSIPIHIYVCANFRIDIELFLFTLIRGRTSIYLDYRRNLNKLW